MVAIDPSRGRMATMDRQGLLTVMKQSTGEVIGSQLIPDLQGDLAPQIAFSPDGTLLAVAKTGTPVVPGIIFLFRIE